LGASVFRPMSGVGSLSRTLVDSVIFLLPM
jgi:hypothetical protein